MSQERFQRYILPGSIEQDPGFRKEVERLSHIGLRVVGGVEVAATLFMTSAQMLLNPSREMLPVRLLLMASMLAVGGLTLLAGRLQSLYCYSRLIAIGSALMATAVLTWWMLLLTRFDSNAVDFIPGNIALVMLVGTAAIPFRPTDMLVFGFLVETIYVGMALVGQRVFQLGQGVDPIYVLFIFMLTGLATALTAVMYDQRRSTYETGERLRAAEGRNLLSENAASVGRLAAALSHELNSPIGALVSGVDTLLLLGSRQAHASEADQQRLLLLQNDLRKSIKQSTDRLRDIVQRTQRFSNLDKAEIQEANVNDLISDVAALLEYRYKDKVEVEMDLQPAPPLVCRPQQLSAVFSNLMGNAIDATGEGGRVTVSSRSGDEGIEIEFADSGRGLDRQELKTIFDPGFKVAHGRVSTGNWGMFSSRQIVREHGGEIYIESELDRGTRVRVVLPAVGVKGAKGSL
jgi:signal transduction histidine kinase